MERLSIIPTEQVVLRHPDFIEWLEDKNLSWHTFADHVFALPLTQYNRDGLDADLWGSSTRPGVPVPVDYTYTLELTDDVLDSLLSRVSMLDDDSQLAEAYADQHPTAYQVCYPVIRQLLEYVASFLPDLTRTPVRDADPRWQPAILSLKSTVGYDLILVMEYTLY